MCEREDAADPRAEVARDLASAWASVAAAYLRKMIIRIWRGSRFIWRLSVKKGMKAP